MLFLKSNLNHVMGGLTGLLLLGVVVGLGHLICNHASTALVGLDMPLPLVVATDLVVGALSIGVLVSFTILGVFLWQWVRDQL